MGNYARFQFSEVVVIDNNLVGVIVKTWHRETGIDEGWYFYEVYVRSYNGIKEYREDEIRQLIYHKELLNEEKEYYD